MASLNDLVHSWGLANGYVSYDEAKRALTDGLTQDEVADLVAPPNFNEGLASLAAA